MIGVLRRTIDRVGRIGAHPADLFEWAIVRQSTSEDDQTRNTESENIMPTKNLRDFVKEAKAEDDPYIVDFGGEIGEVKFNNPADFLVEDQFSLSDSESPREALKMYIGAEAYTRAWPVIKSLKVSELNDMMADARDHFRKLNAG